MKTKGILLQIILIVSNFCYAQFDIEWSLSFGGSERETVSSLFETTDGYTVFGITNSDNEDILENYGGTDILMLGLDESGSVEWQKSFGGSDDDYVTRVLQIEDGGYFILGGSKSNDGDVSGNHGENDIWVAEISNDGIIEWSKSYGGSLDDHASGIVQSTDGGYCILGYSESIDGDVTANIGGYDFWVIKIDSAGEIEWDRSFGGTNYEFATDIVKVDDSYTILGMTHSDDGDVTGHIGDDDIWIINISSEGELLWSEIFGGTGYEMPYSFKKTTDGGFIFGCVSSSGDGDYPSVYGDGDAWITKLNSVGEVEWKNAYGGSNVEIPRGIEPIAGGYILTFISHSNDFVFDHNYGNSDVWLVEIDNTGEILRKQVFGGSSRDDGVSVKEVDDGYALFGFSRSSDFDLEENKGLWDIWVFKVSRNDLAINNNNLVSEIEVYPNPTENLLWLDKKLHLANLNYTLVDHLGRIVQVGQLNEPAEAISLEKIASGQYVLIVEISEDLFYSKVIKK